MDALIGRCAAGAAAVAALAGCMSQPASKLADDPAAPRIVGNHTLECDRQGGAECWVPLVITRDGPRCTVAYYFARVETPRHIKVVWYLNRTEGYEFDATRGIDIKNNNGAFGNPGHHNGRTHQFTWMANPTGSGQERQYDIHVRHSASGSRCDFVDPVIFNRG